MPGKNKAESTSSANNNAYAEQFGSALAKVWDRLAELATGKGDLELANQRKSEADWFREPGHEFNSIGVRFFELTGAFFQDRMSEETKEDPEVESLLFANLGLIDSYSATIIRNNADKDSAKADQLMEHANVYFEVAASGNRSKLVDAGESADVEDAAAQPKNMSLKRAEDSEESQNQ